MSRLTDSEITEMIAGLPDWSVLEEDGMKRLNREFSFGDFASALEFTNRVGDLAEESNHHPRLVTEWGKVTVTWWSHDQGGMVAADIDMAKKVDAVFT
ncbi:MAG: 4a-hydroxytetrahydrobiopterin dehydratase [SAR202 cluster bacterium]|nr:4a-hydroxytetrahydrobiopterin dehydratase [SAR202 cluster bacterium]